MKFFTEYIEDRLRASVPPEPDDQSATERADTYRNDIAAIDYTLQELEEWRGDYTLIALGCISTAAAFVYPPLAFIAPTAVSALYSDFDSRGVESFGSARVNSDLFFMNLITRTKRGGLFLLNATMAAATMAGGENHAGVSFAVAMVLNIFGGLALQHMTGTASELLSSQLGRVREQRRAKLNDVFK